METRFFLKKKKNSKDGIIHFAFTLHNKKQRFSTGITMKQKDWKEGFPKKINSTVKIREDLDFLKEELNNFIDEKQKSENRLPTKYELERECGHQRDGRKTKEIDDSIKTLIQEMLDEQKSELKAGTIRYKIIHLNHFIQFVGEKRTINDLYEDLLLKYRRYLISEGREDVTSNCYIKSVKSFLNWLFEKRIINYQISKRIKYLKEIKKDIIALTDDEIEILETSNLETHLQNQIDIFLFGCYTALSISDIKRVNREMTINDEIKIWREKTGTNLKIPLIPEAVEILKKHNYKLPCISDNKGNEKLKIAFKKLGMNRIVRISKKYNNNVVDRFVPLYEIISWHKSRKTAITSAIKKGIPHVVVMKLSGHTKFETFMKYVELANDDLKNEMNKLSKTKNESIAA